MKIIGTMAFLCFQDDLSRIEEIGSALETALNLDNAYTEQSSLGLAQQWDQLESLSMRMQHNLDQQIQARYANRKHVFITCKN